ncbi:hypothetical protein LBMAG34_4540 [Candidatus Saccharibacteria bacterium]|nr:hypothetical protein LBMAG34_4540 [Candidatus Saccharibacteria bacterium]
MKFINKILQAILLIVFLCLVYSISIVGVFSSNQKLTKVLDESGFYEASSKLMAEELNKQVSSSNSLLNEAIKNSISTTVNSDVAKSVIQPAQIVLLEWLNNKQDSLNVDLDLLPIKNKVSLKTTDNQVRFEITRLLPDSFILLDDSKDESNILPQLLRVKELYRSLEQLIPYLWLVLGSTIALLFLLNLRSGSKKINRILVPILIGSVFGIIIALGSSFASTSIGLDIASSSGIDNFQLLTKLLLTIARDTFTIFAIISAASLAGVFISKAVFRGRDKHLKKKNKK